MTTTYVETRWTFQAGGREFTGTRNTGATMETYIIHGDKDNKPVVFTHKQLEPLRQFLAAMDHDKLGEPVFRCKHCDMELHYDLSAESRWLDEDEGSECEENDPGMHELA